MINCIALDDEPLALEIIRAFCERLPQVELKKTFTSTEDAAKYIRNFPVDLLFLDIQMPDMNGIEFYKSLNKQIALILTTAYSEYAVEGFNVNAIDYLLKPFEFRRFEMAIQRACDYHKYLRAGDKEENAHLYVRVEYSLMKIAFQDILFIETDSDYLKIHLQGRKPILTLMTMKQVLEKLPNKGFSRVHRSYLVSLRYIESVRGKNIYLGAHEIPIGASYEADFFKSYAAETFF